VQSQAALVWVSFMQPVAILTMFLGNLLAITQTSVKRMLAYSSIAQAGYILIGVTAVGFAASRGEVTGALPESVAAVIFYLATYMLTNIGAFTIVGIISQRMGGDQLKELQRPVAALAVPGAGHVAVLLSLTAHRRWWASWASWFLFRAAVNEGLVMLVVVGVVKRPHLGVLLPGRGAGHVCGSQPERGAAVADSVCDGLGVIVTSGRRCCSSPSYRPRSWDIALAAAKSMFN